MKKMYIVRTYLLLVILTFLTVGCGDGNKLADCETGKIYLSGKEESVLEKEAQEREAEEVLTKEEILAIESEEGREVDLADYSSCLGRVWYVQEGDPHDNNIPVSLVVTQIREGCIEGYMAFGWITGYRILPVEPDFRGVIYDGTAECKYSYSSYGGEREGVFSLTFIDEDHMEVELENDEEQCYLLRPFNLSGEILSDVSITEVELESWGTVNLVSGICGDLHPCPTFYITNERNDILYDCDTSCGVNGWEVWDIFLEDMDNDGMQDLVAVTCAFDETCGGRYVRIFYQGTNGSFFERSVDTEMLPSQYYGDYQIIQFCPTEDYPEHEGEWITRQEADSLSGRIVEIREDMIVTYDTERRRGTRNDRQAPRSDNEVLEYSVGSATYYWTELTPEMMQNCSATDDTMKDAVGEEYYGKVNGVFICNTAAIQWFFTLEGEDGLIMYSLLSKQYFILEKVEQEKEVSY